MPVPTYVFGAHQISDFSEDDLRATVDILKRHNISHIDTALIYTGSEERLGKIEAAKSFTIDTKSPSFVANALGREQLNSGITKSLSSLQTDKVDIYYLHAPDQSTPIEETVDTVQELYRQGKFERFGLSNFLPDDVRRIHAYAKSRGGVVPTVYQGNYNAFARSIEQDLFPLLRELGLSFYAYSPIAGGLFARDPEHLANKKESGRFDTTTVQGQIYNSLYNKPTLVEGLRQWQKFAEDVGIPSIALAYRWVVFHSGLDGQKGDAVILGASRPRQLEQTLEFLEQGPLAEDIINKVEELWKLVEPEAPLDNFNSAVFNF